MNTKLTIGELRVDPGKEGCVAFWHTRTFPFPHIEQHQPQEILRWDRNQSEPHLQCSRLCGSPHFGVLIYLGDFSTYRRCNSPDGHEGEQELRSGLVGAGPLLWHRLFCRSLKKIPKCQTLNERSRGQQRTREHSTVKYNKDTEIDRKVGPLCSWQRV